MEQGFWYGAMYISYAFGVMITVAVVIALSVLTNYSLTIKLAASFVALVLFMPLIFRYSRNIWLSIFVRYKTDKSSKSE